jgi:hypothetical protein
MPQGPTPPRPRFLEFLSDLKFKKLFWTDMMDTKAFTVLPMRPHYFPLIQGGLRGDACPP